MWWTQADAKHKLGAPASPDLRSRSHSGRHPRCEPWLRAGLLYPATARPAAPQLWGVRPAREKGRWPPQSGPQRHTMGLQPRAGHEPQALQACWGRRDCRLQHSAAIDLDGPHEGEEAGQASGFPGDGGQGSRVGAGRPLVGRKEPSSAPHALGDPQSWHEWSLWLPEPGCSAWPFDSAHVRGQGVGLLGQPRPAPPAKPRGQQALRGSHANDHDGHT